VTRRSLPRKVTYFGQVPTRLARTTIIEATFEVGRRFRSTTRGDCGQLDPGAVIRPVAGGWHPNCRGSSTKMSFRTGPPAVQPSISSVGARLAVAGAYSRRRKKGKAPAGDTGVFRPDGQHFDRLHQTASINDRPG
jgi:hypothetical protein